MIKDTKVKIRASRIIKGFCAVLLLGIHAASCSQDAIFYIISKETAPIPPRIEGSPTRMVEFEREYNGSPIPLLFVASGDLHWYGGNPASPRWDSRDYGIPEPRGKIMSLAVTQDRLYALCLNGKEYWTTTLQYMEKSGGWGTIPGVSEYSLIQSIYADPDDSQDLLFVGARKDDDKGETYAILYLDTTEQRLKRLTATASMLSGAAYRNGYYYLCTREDGIFRVDTADLPGSLSQLSGSKEVFMGMIKLPNTDEFIVAIERDDGALYQIEDNNPASSFSLIDSGFGNRSTGALALWENGLVSILVAGRQGSLSSSSNNNGYVEFMLDSNYSVIGSYAGNNLYTVLGEVAGAQYSSSLKKRPINHLFQAPSTIDNERTFFASTQTTGLWSFRDRSGGLQWNAED